MEFSNFHDFVLKYIRAEKITIFISDLKIVQYDSNKNKTLTQLMLYMVLGILDHER